MVLSKNKSYSYLLMFLLPDCTPFQTALLCHKLSLLLLKGLYSPAIFREPKTYFLSFLCKCNTHPTHHCSSSDCTGCFSSQDILQGRMFWKAAVLQRLGTPAGGFSAMLRWTGGSSWLWGDRSRQQPRLPFPFPGQVAAPHTPSTLSPICFLSESGIPVADVPLLRHGGCQSCQTTTDPPVTLESGHLIGKNKILHTWRNTPYPTSEDPQLFQGLFTLR